MKKIFITSLIGLLSAVSWGQSACGQTNPVEIREANFMHANDGENRPFQKPTTFNLKNTRMRNGKQFIFLEVTFRNPVNRRTHGNETQQAAVLTMVLPNWLEPYSTDGKYPQGYNIADWRDSPANNEGRISGTTQRFPAFPRFTNTGDSNRFNRNEYRIGIVKSVLGRNPDPTHNSNGNGTAMEFELKEGTYVKNYQMELKVGTFTGYNSISRQPTYCNRSDDFRMANSYTIDLVRPTFDEMAETTIKVDEEFSFDIPARDLDSNQNPIAQTLKTGVTAPTSRENIEDGVYIELKSVKKIVNLAGGGYPQRNS